MEEDIKVINIEDNFGRRSGLDRRNISGSTPPMKKGAAKNGELSKTRDPGWTEGVGLRIGPQQNRITVLSEETVETAGVVRTEEISLCFKSKMSKNKAHVPCRNNFQEIGFGDKTQF